MAALSGTNLLALGVAGAGGLALWSGTTGAGLLAGARELLQGEKPSSADTNPIPGSGGDASSDAATETANLGSVSAAKAQTLAKALSVAYGWSTGTQWNDLVALWQQESGWSDTAQNGTSGAAGIPQNIQGWSSSYQKGNAAQQIQWGLTYIRQRYGSPAAAWAHEQSEGWY